MSVLKTFRHEYKFVIPYEEMLALRENIEASEVSAKFFDEAMEKVKPKSANTEEELIQYF